MSNKPESGIDNSISEISEPKSSKKMWIFGGLGCFGLVALALGLAVVIYLFAFKPQIDFVNENIGFLQSSPEIQTRLGNPVEVGEMTRTQEGEALTFRGPISGPKGSGVYVIEAKYEGSSLVRDSFHLEIEGEDEAVDFDPEAMFNLDVDDGSGK